MKRHYWTILGILALLNLFGWFGYLLSIAPKAKAPDPHQRVSPPVLNYRITHYLPGGEVRVYNTDASYSTIRSTIWFKYYQDGQTYRRTLAGSWLIEELP